MCKNTQRRIGNAKVDMVLLSNTNCISWFRTLNKARTRLLRFVVDVSYSSDPQQIEANGVWAYATDARLFRDRPMTAAALNADSTQFRSG